MKRALPSLIVILSLLPCLAPAQPPGRGGPGRGGGGGPLPAEQREKIHDLFAGHKSIERQLTLTKTGYKSRTTSKDPRIAARLKEHVSYMEKRLDSGFPVRRWDPAYVEFFAHYDQLETKITKIANGLEVVVTGKTPEAIKVAQNHATIISGFVEKGEVEHHARHPAVLGGKDDAAAPGGPGKGKGCPDCKGACECGKGAKPGQANPAAKAAPACKDCAKPAKADPVAAPTPACKECAKEGKPDPGAKK